MKNPGERAPWPGSAQSPVRDMPKMSMLGVRIDSIPLRELLNLIVKAAEESDRLIVANVNAYAMNLAYTLPSFKTYLNRADVVFCDGFGVKWAARLLGFGELHRHTPPDWVPLLCQKCFQRDLTLFFLGGHPGVPEMAAARVREASPGLRIGVLHGYFDKRPDGEENQRVLGVLNAFRPDILIVGFGMPLQEQWVSENWNRIDATVVVTVGALFEYLAGSVQRAPAWMTDHGLEWLGRLFIEPRRLWRRYLLGNPLFLWRVLKQRLGMLPTD
jgi:N-acetylglucosaminyldiphosphoundecaprenol N-acetyl-beta-D-mannosaminyltransferase